MPSEDAASAASSSLSAFFAACDAAEPLSSLSVFSRQTFCHRRDDQGWRMSERGRERMAASGAQDASSDCVAPSRSNPRAAYQRHIARVVMHVQAALLTRIV